MSDLSSMVKALIEHDHERMSCLNHDGLCCPAGDAHDMTTAQAAEHQAGAVAKAALGDDPVLRAWVEPGINPPYHERMKARVRKIMPVLARHLDEKAKGVR